MEKAYKLRQDGYSRGIAGESSGGICSLNAAWFMPDKFSRVHSTIGSFTSIQWRPEQNLDGGNLYPFKVRKEPKRNIRVWMSDGMDDLENDHGSWPLQNIQLANSLKMREYDYHFRFGMATHDSAQAGIDLPGIACMALARVRRRQDVRSVHHRSNREGKALLSSDDCEPGCLVKISAIRPTICWTISVLYAKTSTHHLGQGHFSLSATPAGAGRVP